MRSPTVLVLLVAVVLAAAAATADAARPKVPRFAHVIVVVFENTEGGDVLGLIAAPTFNSLARSYAQLGGTTAVGGVGSVAALALGQVVRPGSTYALPTSHHG